MRNFRGANPAKTGRARELRRDSTDVEKRPWQLLRGRQINGLKFVRQQPIGQNFADFACREARLVVELDGGGMQTVPMTHIATNS